ncbi:thioredoxin family protein [Flavobacterium frigidarium]|uniref:thioredoxin family protein n=1 Tax=Flavobacterium frigidarium TaxID=99286 RepID=UPI00047B301C|nr:thioredoxin family protein [Flavobacterium frigidarium]
MKTFWSLVLITVVFNGYSQNWNTNFKQASADAASQNKPIILVFSGSDWCAPCIKLDKSIWQSEAFKNYSNTNYIMERADFPRRKQNELTEELKKQNQVLAEKYNHDGIFPLVVVLNADGKVLGKTTYKNTTPEIYIEELNAFLK